MFDPIEVAVEGEDPIAARHGVVLDHAVVDADEVDCTVLDPVARDPHVVSAGEVDGTAAVAEELIAGDLVGVQVVAPERADADPGTAVVADGEVAQATAAEAAVDAGAELLHRAVPDRDSVVTRGVVDARGLQVAVARAGLDAVDRVAVQIERYVVGGDHEAVAATVAQVAAQPRVRRDDIAAADDARLRLAATDRETPSHRGGGDRQPGGCCPVARRAPP